MAQTTAGPQQLRYLRGDGFLQLPHRAVHRVDVWRHQRIQHGVHLEDSGRLPEDRDCHGAYWDREGARHGKGGRGGEVREREYVCVCVRVKEKV